MLVASNGKAAPDLVRRLEERGGAPARTIFMSGYTAHVMLDAHALTREQRFLEEPFTREQLLRSIPEALDG